MELDRITNAVEGRYWHMLDDGRVQCDLCPRYCKLHEGQRGLCFVRARQAGLLSDIEAMALDANVTDFEDELGGCERILKTKRVRGSPTRAPGCC